MDEKLKRADFGEILSAMKMTWEDFDANRHERLAPAQVKRLEHEAHDMAGGAAAVVVIGAIVSGCQMLYPSPKTLFIAVLVAGFCLLLMAVFLLRYGLLRCDLAERRVQKSAGPLRTLVFPDKGKVRYYARIARTSYEVTAPVFVLLKMREDEIFNVYFTRRTKTLLALEPTEKLKNDDIAGRI